MRRSVSLYQSANTGSGVAKRVSRSVGSGRVTVAVKLEKGGCLAPRRAFHQAPVRCRWATLNAGRRDLAMRIVVKPSSGPTATPNAGTVSTTMTAAASPKRNFKHRSIKQYRQTLPGVPDA